MRYIVLFLMLAAVGWGVRPCIVSNPLFKTGSYTHPKYYIYVPAEPTGEYWVRYAYNQMYAVAANKTFESYSISNCFFGKVYPGQQQIFTSATEADLTPATASSGTWATNEAGWAGWTDKVKQTSTSGGYVTFTVPDASDRVHVFIALAPTSDFGIWTVSYDGDEIDSTVLGTIDLDALGDSYNKQMIVEYPISTEMGAATNKTVTLTAANGTCTVLGIRTFDVDTHSTTPGALDGSSLWLGHDMITIYEPENISDGYVQYNYQAAVSGYSDMVGITSRDCAWTFSWNGGSGNRWTSSGSHWAGSGNAPLKNTTAAELYVDGVQKGTLNDSTDIPVGTVYEGDCIEIRGGGYADYDNGGSQSAGVDPTIAWENHFTTNYCRVKLTITWAGSTAFNSDGPYMCMLYFPSTVSGSVMDSVSSASSNWTPTSTFTMSNAGSVFVFPSGKNYYIQNSVDAPISEYEKPSASLNKLYFDVDETALTSPAEGVVTQLGGFFSIVKKPSWISSTTTSGSSGGVYRGGLFGN